MATKLYVGGLSYDTNNNSLKECFETQGTVVSADVIIDKFSNKSRGFGFVTMETAEGAEAAINNLSGKDLDGRTISVSAAREKTDGDRKGGNFRQGGGRGRDNRGGSSFRFR